MDRAYAEIKLKQFIKYDKKYSLKELYQNCENELVWNCGFCPYGDFMKIEKFSTWIKKMDWIGKSGCARLSTVKYQRTDEPESIEMSDQYEPAMKIYNWRKNHTWLR